MTGCRDESSFSEIISVKLGMPRLLVGMLELDSKVIHLHCIKKGYARNTFASINK